jgi:hypothetical protein
VMFPSEVQRRHPNVIREEACVCCQGPPLNQPHGRPRRLPRGQLHLLVLQASTRFGQPLGCVGVFLHQPAKPTGRRSEEFVSSLAKLKCARGGHSGTPRKGRHRRLDGISALRRDLVRDPQAHLARTLPSPVSSCSPAMAVTPPFRPVRPTIPNVRLVPGACQWDLAAEHAQQSGWRRWVRWLVDGGHR